MDTFKPNGEIMTPRGLCLLWRVDKLIDPPSRVWDEMFLNSFFWPVDVHHIFLVPISQGGIEDFVAWSFNKNIFFIGSLSLRIG